MKPCGSRYMYYTYVSVQKPSRIFRRYRDSASLDGWLKKNENYIMEN